MNTPLLDSSASAVSPSSSNNQSTQMWNSAKSFRDAGKGFDRYFNVGEEKNYSKIFEEHIKKELSKKFDKKAKIKVCADIEYNDQKGWTTTLKLPDPAPQKEDGSTHTDVKEYLESFHKNQGKTITARGGRKTRTGKRRKRGKSRRRGKRC